MILCGGPINSPHLLKLSGVGPVDGAAASTASPSCHDLPGVGENLQDHLEFYFQVACTAARDAVLRHEPGGEGR